MIWHLSEISLSIGFKTSTFLGSTLFLNFGKWHRFDYFLSITILQFTPLFPRLNCKHETFSFKFCFYLSIFIASPHLQVGLVLRSMGFDNSTRIYLASGELFGGDRFMKPFRALFPHLENHSTVGPEKLEENARGLAGSAVDYMVCLLSDIFMPTYDGPSNFANNLMGHRLYYGFRTTITPNRKALAPVFMDREEGKGDRFEERVRKVMFSTGKFGGPHKRIRPESFYTNSWPECFCQVNARNKRDKCPPSNVVELLESRLQSEELDESENREAGNSNSTAGLSDDSFI